MSEFDDAEFDVHEFAEQLGYTDELGRHDMSDPNIERATTKSSRGLSRRDLVVKGGLGAAALTGLGGVAGQAPRGSGSKNRYTGTLRVITLGVEWPQGAEQQAEKDLGFKFNVQPMSTNAQVQKSITAPDSFDMLRWLQLPVLPDLANGQLPGRRPEQDQGVEQLLPRLHEGEGAPRPRRTARPVRATRPTACSTSTRTAARAFRSPRKGRATTGRSSSGGTTVPTRRTAASRSRRRSWGRRPTSTWTRWATTATSSRSSRARSRGPSSSTASTRAASRS